jgi:hypothetical protein
MTPQIRIVLEIASAGVILLFAALGALVSLMYLLTNPAVFGGPARERRRARRKEERRLQKKRAQPAPPNGQLDSVGAGLQTRPDDRLAEQDRRRRAAALAVAIARAERDSALVFSEDVPSDWRLLHRNLRLNQRPGRSASAREARDGQTSPKPGGGAS